MGDAAQAGQEARGRDAHTYLGRTVGLDRLVEGEELEPRALNLTLPGALKGGPRRQRGQIECGLGRMTVCQDGYGICQGRQERSRGEQSRVLGHSFSLCPALPSSALLCSTLVCRIPGLCNPAHAWGEHIHGSRAYTSKSTPPLLLCGIRNM